MSTQMRLLISVTNDGLFSSAKEANDVDPRTSRVLRVGLMPDNVE